MKIGKIIGSDCRFLGICEKQSFKNASNSVMPKNDNARDEVSFEKKGKSGRKDVMPEIGIVLSSIITGGIILYGLFGGKKI